MITAISAYNRRYKVTFIKNAAKTINTGEDYELSVLEISYFVGTVLHWSKAIELLDL